jgi:hypothetical protein
MRLLGLREPPLRALKFLVIVSQNVLRFCELLVRGSCDTFDQLQARCLSSAGVKLEVRDLVVIVYRYMYCHTWLWGYGWM